jgi:hypothetical protein
VKHTLRAAEASYHFLRKNGGSLLNRDKENVSRKGAVAQRKNAKVLNAACSLRALLCAFAREFL